MSSTSLHIYLFRLYIYAFSIALSFTQPARHVALVFQIDPRMIEGLSLMVGPFSDASRRRPWHSTYSGAWTILFGACGP